MKKLWFAVLATAFLFASCGKEDPAQGVKIDEIFKSTATIKGVAYISSNTSDETALQFAPKDSKLIFTIANTAYGLTGSGNYVKEALVGEDGAFSVELPAKNDGGSVTVSISAEPIVLTVNKNGVAVNQIFTLTAGTSEDIIKGYVYQKKLTYNAANSDLGQTVNWEPGTYKATLQYYDGKNNVDVPADTEVKITVAKNLFTPVRAEDYVFIEKVGANGALEFTMDAKALIDGGLAFTMKSSFVAKYTTVTSGVETSLNYKFDLSSASGTIYGGITNDGGTKTFTKGTNPIETQDILSTWKESTFAVKYLYDKDAFDPANNYVAIPADAKVTITEYRTTVNTTLSNVIKTMTYGEFIALNSGAGYKTLAPDPAISGSSLNVKIEINFLVDRKTGENANGGAINNKFKYVYSDTFSLRGTITTNGGSDFTQPDGSTEVKNSVYLDAAFYATKLTSN
ncbi:hypothetical protein D0T49_03000 [Paludibacter sp. 221]|uniref:hypothetical protein n=1 Tax=Paludibacter sp. 221 TaxID=2302939 RepID=UPI0013D6C723|nr:hypothetical protein [Paludibacter sp. 221]NDV46007.1 hypothetical protein [Paludibacter sp. 221]